MNPYLLQLHAYPFERLATLKAGTVPPASLTHIALSIGEPQHLAPDIVVQALIKNMDGLSKYPTTKGIPALRKAMAQWCTRRFHLQMPLDADTQILPVNGTREALFAFAQAAIDKSNVSDGQKPIVISPNPFYQIYEGAAFLAGAELYFVNCIAEKNFLPDFSGVPAEIWRRCQLVFICSPGNPTGSVMDVSAMQQLIALADEHDFIIASDECYSELYFDESLPPAGLLQACSLMGRHDFRRCVVFHSLSKRSNLPGLRSGFVAGDAKVLERFLLYRTYHGCAMPVQHQYASIAAWQDENHVIENRRFYTEKFDAVLTVLDGCLDVCKPSAGFYLWAKTPVTKTLKNDADFALALFAETNITVLPGSFLSRDTQEGNPGVGYVRMALVASLAECAEAANRIKAFMTRHLN